MKKKFYVFDLDGVLINSKKNMSLSWKQVRKKTGIKQKFKDYFQEIGKPFNVILRNLGVKRNLHSKIEKEYSKASIKNFSKIKLYPKSRFILQKLKKKGKIVGLLTSKDKKRVLKLLKKFKLKFDIVLCPLNKRLCKPNPHQLNLAVKKFNIKKTETVYIGDMPVDKLTAKKSSIDFVYCKYGYGNLVKQKYSINNISKILSIKFN